MPGVQESGVCPEESAMGGAEPGGHSGPALPGRTHQGSHGGKVKPRACMLTASPSVLCLE